MSVLAADLLLEAVRLVSAMIYLVNAYILLYPFWVCFISCPWVFFYSRVAEAYPVTTDLLLRVKATTAMVHTTCMIDT